MPLPLTATVLLVSATLLVATTISGPCRAEDEMQSMRINCTVDYLRFCAGMNPEGSEVRACFKRNRPNLSRACISAIVAYEDQHRTNDEEDAQ